ncbi:MAG: hypothetical protein O7B35_10500 [Deltaproteobacteria bacterium]|nr:hypothetical protein [Deltaproteobacteria bacterium]
MARRPRLFASGLLYHVIVRGNQRQITARYRILSTQSSNPGAVQLYPAAG